MSSVQYPFIDLAVHERVRLNYAAGKAVIIFSPEMDEVVWSNGAGARLFGYSDIYDLIEQGPPASDLTFRQAKASARPLQSVGDVRSFLIRMTSGFDRLAVQASLELISLPNDQHAVLLAVPAGTADAASVETAAQMLQGFNDPSTHMAVLDHQGQVITASGRFAALELPAATVELLLKLAGTGQDRLKKRSVPTSLGNLPTAIARLSDDPMLFLVMLVQPVQGNDVEDQIPVEPMTQTEESAPVQDEAFETALDAVTSIDDMDEEIDEDPDFVSVSTVPAQPLAEEIETDETLAGEETAAADVSNSTLIPEQPDQADQAVMQHEQADVAPAVPLNTGFRRETRATRFVWKIDAEGYFSEISPELAASVGPHAAEIVGLSFNDVAALFNLDPEGKISELLNRRDTWSGKTIWWPVEGTSAVVPIDLAALPTYSRNREFDGFRGFGIIRLADAEEDESALGLTFVQSHDDAEIEQDTFSPKEEPVGTVSEQEIADEGTAPLLTQAVDAAEVVVEETTDSPENANDTALDLPSTETASTSYPADEAGVEAISSTDLAAEKAETTDEPDDVTDEEVEAYYLELDTWDPADAEDAGDTSSQPAGQNAPIRLPAYEKPVLRIIENPGLRYSDKVIRFDERRNNLQDGLTAGEQAAFREIARKLDAFRRGEDVKSEKATVSQEPENVPHLTNTEAAETAENQQASSESPAAPARSAVTSAPVPRSLLEAGEDLQKPVEAEVEVEVETEEAAALLEAETDDNAEPEVAVEPDAGDAEDDRISLAQAYAQAIPLRPRPELTGEIIDQMPVALLVHSGDTLIHANSEFLRLSGYESLQALSDVGGLDALLQRQDLDDKTSEAGGMVVVREDDSIVPVTARLQSVRYDGATALILALMPSQSTIEFPEPIAASEPVPAEQTHKADEIAHLEVEVEELRAILDTATDGVVLMGADGTIRSMNRAASALFNYENEQTSGKPFVMLFAHESQKSVLDYLHGLSSHGVISLLNDGREVIGREASGGFVPLFMTIGKLTSSNGYCAVIRDITQWKRTEDELRSAKRAAETANAHKSDFLAHVSHEIRTPLNAIIGFADMMATERLGPVGHSRYIEYANDIGRSGRHVLDIVNDLLDISKIEAGEMELDFVSVGLNETVAEAVSLVQPQANTQRVIIRTALSHSVPPVVADLRSVKQIVLNILSNAIRFTPSGGQIVVSTSYEANGSVVLRVRDTGIGMTRSELELAMKPFRQVAGASRKRGDGTGLGLPLTKAMVDANRASFTIHSAPNEGTLVEIAFPSPRVLAH